MNKKRNFFIKLVLNVCVAIFIVIACVAFKPGVVVKADVEPINSWFTWYDYLDFDYTNSEDVYGNVSAMGYTAVTLNYNGIDYNSSDINYLYVSYSQRKVYYSYRIVEKDFGTIQSLDVVVYEDGEWVNDDFKYIYLTSFDASGLGDTLYDFIEANGVFTLSATIPQATLTDLIFEIGDIVPRTIQSLTSFQIFGYTFFVILGTFLLVILIIKIFFGVKRT